MLYKKPLIPLWLELSILVIIKMTFLYFIWWFCFSKPGVVPTIELTSQHILFQEKEQ